MVSDTNFLKRLLSFLTALFTVILLTATGYAVPLTGIKTVGGGGTPDYATLALAIADLNANGVGSGGVTFNVAAGFIDTFKTATAGRITATGTSANPIVFQKSGGGANPIITAFASGASTTLDGMIFIEGGDYITFEGIDLRENASNLNATQQMEWGYALVKKQNTAPFDGCQYITIRNCDVSLNKANTNSRAIYSGNHIYNATTSLTITATSDAMSNCKFYSNTIHNSFWGISLNGYNHNSAPYTLFDQNNEIGVSGGNNVYDFGPSGTFNGIYATNQNLLKVNNNTVTLTGAVAAAATTVNGINTASGTQQSVEINNNNISLAVSGSFNLTAIGINNNIGGTTIPNTVSIKNNVIHDFTVTNTSATLGNATTQGIFNQAGYSADISGNVVRDFNATGISTMYGIQDNNAANSNNYVYNNNVYNLTKNSPSGALAGIFCNSGLYSVYNNSVHDITYNHLNAAGTGTANINMDGILLSSNPNPSISVYNNTVYNLTVSSANYRKATLAGFRSTANGNGFLFSVHDNVFRNFSTANSSSGDANVFGIFPVAGYGGEFYRNNIYDLSAVGDSGQTVGIYAGNGPSAPPTYNHKIYNNIISDLRAPASTISTAIAGMMFFGNATSSGEVPNVFAAYNTVYINAASLGAGAKTYAVFANNTGTFELRNNILINTSVTSGGLTVALRILTDAGLPKYALTSNNNEFYAGVPSASNLIYYDSTVNTNVQTLAQYQVVASIRDANSISVAPAAIPFINIAATPYDLHLNAAFATQIESGAQKVTSPILITDDFDSQVRYGEVGYAGTGTAPDIGADEFNGIPIDLVSPNISFTPLSNAGNTSARSLTAAITDASGVPTSGLGLPVLYWKINFAGVWSGATASSPTLSQYPFSFGAGVVTGDTVYYYICAQDQAGTPNVGSSPNGGASGFTTNPPAAGTAPTSPNYYVILQSISGIVNVDSTTGSVYTSLTGAAPGGLFADINSKVVTGNITAYIKTDIIEPGTVALNQWVEDPSGSNYTLTILPFDPSPKTLSGTTVGPMITINGADRVTFSGQGQLTFRNSSAVSTAVGSTFKFINGSVSCTIDSCRIENNYFDPFGAASAHVYIADGANDITISRCTLREPFAGTINMYKTAISMTPNNQSIKSRLTLQNNYISNFVYRGVDITTASDGCVITSNHFYNDSVITAKYADDLKMFSIAGNNGGHNISYNYFGGSAPFCGGSPLTNNSTSPIASNALYLNNNGSTSSVQGNIIQNLLSTGQGIFLVDLRANFNGNVGTIAGNIIGDPTGATSITCSANANVRALSMSNSSAPFCNIENNVVANINGAGGSVVGFYLKNSNVKKNRIFNLNGTGLATAVTGIQLGDLYNAPSYEISNNMISLNTTAPGELKGMADDFTGFVGPANIFYNTVVISGIPSVVNANNSYVLLKNANSSMNVKDNIFINNRTGGTGKHYVIAINGVDKVATLTANYNDYYNADPSKLAAIVLATPLTLAGWQGATTQDANTKSVSVNFASATDLHLAGASIGDFNLRGTPVSVTTDFDGQTRNALYPYMGVDEVPGSPLVWSLNLTALIEGFYNSGTNTMVADTVAVELRNSGTFALVDQSNVVLNSSGNTSANFFSATDATNYYLVLKHRNSMETWSNTPQSFTGGALTYDFTSAANKAYGDNMKQIDASPVKFGIYGGNIAPQDALIDLTDEIAVINDVNAFATGYLPTDLTGDDSADLSDIIIVVNNANAFISKQTPEPKSIVPVKVRQEIKNKVNMD